MERQVGILRKAHIARVCGLVVFWLFGAVTPGFTVVGLKYSGSYTPTAGPIQPFTFEAISTNVMLRPGVVRLAVSPFAITDGSTVWTITDGFLSTAANGQDAFFFVTTGFDFTQGDFVNGNGLTFTAGFFPHHDGPGAFSRIGGDNSIFRRIVNGNLQLLQSSGAVDVTASVVSQSISISVPTGTSGGDQQTGGVQTQLPNPLVVTASNPDGTPASGVSISFSVTPPPGAIGFAVTNAVAVTGADGAAFTKLTLGDKPGLYRVVASCSSGQTCSPNAVVFTETADCHVNIPTKWSQAQSPWGSDRYDSCGLTPPTCSHGILMRGEGCATTALAMALKASGVDFLPDLLGNFVDLDPGSLNQFMISHTGDYSSNHNVQFETATLHVSFATFALRGRKTLYFDDSLNGSNSLSDLKNAICQGHSVIVIVAPISQCVVQPGPIGGHYVLVIGEHDDSIGSPHFDIVDPGCAFGFGSSPAITSLDTYNNNFVIRGFVSDPVDVSTLEAVTDDTAELLVTDAAGNRTGFDQLSLVDRKEIPRSSYFRDFITDDDIGQQATGITHSINLFQPIEGTYYFTVNGLKLGPHTLFISSFCTDGTPQLGVSLPVISTPGSISTFQIQFNSNPGSVSQVVRVATFQSALADILNSRQLGLIDNNGIANSLSKKIQNAQDAVARGKTDAARNILNAFVNEVNAQLGKHVSGIAAQVLIEDVNSILSQTVH